MNKLINNMELYAKENNIPIMEKEGIEFLSKFIREKNIKNILEVGSAIGYSAIKMALDNPGVNIVTIELNKSRYDMAVENINKLDLNDRIIIYNDDALLIDIQGEFDLIFIDAAKAQYIKFFEKYRKNLTNNGYLISDNLKFHGFVNDSSLKMSRNLRQLVGKIKRYIEFLENNEEYSTKFIDIGDGIAVSKRR